MGDGELTRRTLLKGGGALIVTFAFLPKGLLAETAGLTDKSVSPDAVGGYIAIDAQGMVTLYSGKVELGTGAVTAITQMAAEELSVPMTCITTIQGRHAAHTRSGANFFQPFDSERRYAGAARCRNCAGSIARQSGPVVGFTQRPTGGS